LPRRICTRPIRLRRALTPERSLARMAPGVAARWHPTKDGSSHASRSSQTRESGHSGGGPRKVPASAGRCRYWWHCPEGADHEWQQTAGLPGPKVRAAPADLGGGGCLQCRQLQRQRASPMRRGPADPLRDTARKRPPHNGIRSLRHFGTSQIEQIRCSIRLENALGTTGPFAPARRNVRDRTDPLCDTARKRPPYNGSVGSGHS
jgi:hypothetical protein